MNLETYFQELGKKLYIYNICTQITCLYFIENELSFYNE